MSKKINRRSFIKKSTSIGVGSVLGTSLLSEVAISKESIDIAVVRGKNYFTNAIKAVELLGGIKKFVPKNSKVALLPNPQSNNPGTFTKPEIVRLNIRILTPQEVIEMEEQRQLEAAIQASLDEQ